MAKRYDKEFKLYAVNMIVEDGRKVAEVANHGYTDAPKFVKLVECEPEFDKPQHNNAAFTSPSSSE